MSGADARSKGRHPKGSNSKNRNYESAEVVLNNEVASKFSEKKQALDKNRGNKIMNYGR